MPEDATPEESTMPEYVAPEHLDIETIEGTLRIVYEMTVGDLLIVTFVTLLIVFLILNSLMKIVWSRR